MCHSEFQDFLTESSKKDFRRSVDGVEITEIRTERAVYFIIFFQKKKVDFGRF